MTKLQRVSSRASASEPRDLARAAGARSRLSTELATVAAFCGFLFVFGLGSFGLVGADEPRYAQIAREMLARHDWVTPVLNGVPWLEKPALYYWSAMASYSLFGVSDWAARLPSALLASLMVFAIYLFARRFRPGAQLDAALMTASSVAVIGFSRGASTDMPLTATFTAAMLAWYCWLDCGDKRWLVGSYAALGLATLAKGPVAVVLAGAVVVLLALLRRDLSLLFRTMWWPAMLLFLAVTVPWYALAEISTGTFFRVFFLEHNLERFGTNLYQHQQPIWYYAPVLVLSLLPWTVFALMALGDTFSRLRPRDAARRFQAGWEDQRQLSDYLALWVAVPLVLFTISRSKLPGYILPSIPAATLLLADYLWRKQQDKWNPGWFPVVLHAIAAGSVLAAALLAPSLLRHQPPPGASIVIATACGVAIAAGVIYSLRAQGVRMLRFVTLVPVILGLGFVILTVAPAIDVTQSARPVAAELLRLQPKPGELAIFHVRRELEYGLDFYRNQAPRSYDRGQVPDEDHLLVTRRGSLASLQTMLPKRRFSRVGEFPAQHLEFFWVSTPASEPMEPMNHSAEAIGRGILGSP